MRAIDTRPSAFFDIFSVFCRYLEMLSVTSLKLYYIVVIGVFNQIKYNVNFIQFKFHNILIIPILTYNSTSIG